MPEVRPNEELVDEASDIGTLKPGTRLGRYELLVPIARGGMARVWAARLQGQRGFSKLVAIKTILPQLANEPEFERMFLDEARIASGVHHPNVCEIYELGEDQRTLYLAMEWVSGDSFARVLRASGQTVAIDPRVVARVVADACAGVHAAHELTDEEGQSINVVHRDLSPHNLLVTADGTTKVADFGVAKALGQLHEATTAGQLKGKISYMSPEQVSGQGIDRRSDIFSLGCVLYEATTGTRPFKGEGDHQIMHAILKGDVVAPSEIIRGYPAELERVVLRALSAVPLLRFPTAERMRFALEEFLAKGQLVTQSNVAQVVRSRIGDVLEKRKERIRQASSAGDREGWNDAPASPANDGHRSGVKDGPNAKMTGTAPIAKALKTPAMGAAVVREAGALVSGPSFPESQATIPHAPKALAAGRPMEIAEFAQTSTLAMVSPEQPTGGLTPAPPGTMSATLRASFPDEDPEQPATLLMEAPSVEIMIPVPDESYATLASQETTSSVEPFQPAPGIGQYILAAVVGLIVAAIIGTAAFFAWKSRMANEPLELVPSGAKPAPR